MKKIFFSLVMALALVSCSTEELSNGGTPASDKGNVQLVLSTDGFDMASRAVDESAIHDVNILEYIDVNSTTQIDGKFRNLQINLRNLQEISKMVHYLLWWHQ